MAIPNSVKSIDKDAFYGCSGLTSVTIPQCVSARALADVFPHAYASLNDVTLNDGVTLLGDGLFAGCVSLPSITVPSSVTRVGNFAFKDCSALQTVIYKGAAPDVGTDIYNGTPRSLITSVESGSIGWAGGLSADLPEMWNGRAIAYVSGSGDGGSGGSGDGSPSVVTTVVQQVAAPYALTNAVADRAIASVTVNSDCAIDEFVLKDGEVYDSMLYVSNTADHVVALSLPSGFTYKTIKGATPLAIPASSQCLISITRVDANVFLVMREELDDVK
jgi:hypothetical protein